MPNGTRGALDHEHLASGLAQWLAHRRCVGDVVVDDLERPSVGYSALTVLFRAQWERDDGPVTEHLVLRMAPMAPGLFPDYDLGAQHAAQTAAAAAGVPIAAPLVLEVDPAWLGAPFVVMPRVDGHIVGEAPAFDPWVEGLGAPGQAEMHEEFLEVLARIHGAAVEPAAAGGVPVRGDDAELAYWEDYLRWSSDGTPLPQLADALEWCRTHAPARAPRPPVLCWGDVRFGNLVFGNDLRLRAVLDWDMTVIGAREHDLAWLTSLTTTMTNLTGTRVEGFPDRDGTIAQYEERTGHELHEFDWYETFALVRSTAIMTRIGLLARAAGEQPVMPIEDNPILDILRARTTT
ncbi:MAG TPA: phosphotransferase family protein [Acidimicrobiia bacterium]|nr:phosphotransferase family protein [Acidimicrobiia bacterium]